MSMQCPKCGTDNPAQARFCLTCGEKLIEVCPKCGKDLSFDTDAVKVKPC